MQFRMRVKVGLLIDGYSFHRFIMDFRQRENVQLTKEEFTHENIVFFTKELKVVLKHY